MVGQKNEKINQLHRLLPEGLVVDTVWLEKHGYRRQWREKYVAQGWLEVVVRGVYQRPTGNVEPIFAELVIELQGHADRLNKTVADQLPAFNRMLTRIKRDVVADK